MPEAANKSSESDVAVLPNAPKVSGIDGLKKMSTTAGVGTGDYAEVNIVAVVALGVAIAGALSFFSELFLILSLGAVILALTAWFQIHGSNGTQTGRGLVMAALGISILVGGWTGISVVSEQRQQERDQGEIVAMLDRFTNAIASRNYNAAYEVMTSGFRRRVSMDQFKAPFVNLEALPAYQGTTSIRWDQTKMVFTTSGPNRLARVGIVVGYKNPSSEPTNVTFIASTERGIWMIDRISSLYGGG